MINMQELKDHLLELVVVTKYADHFAMPPYMVDEEEAFEYYSNNLHFKIEVDDSVADIINRASKH